MHSLLRQLFQKKKTKEEEEKKKKINPVSLYIPASQFAWRYPSNGLWACESCERLQAAAVNNDLFFKSILSGSVWVRSVCLASARCDS